MTQIPESSPSPFTGKIRKGIWPLSVTEAAAAADAVGFKATPRSKGDRLHVQRRWNEAATIRALPGNNGVVIRPAWTSAQIVAVIAVLCLLAFGVCLV